MIFPQWHSFPFRLQNVTPPPPTMQDKVFIRHRRSENYPFTMHNSPTAAYDFFYSDVKPLSKYSPVTLQLSPTSRILNENPAKWGRELEGLQLSPSFKASCPYFS